MSLSQGYPSTFSATQTTIDVLHNLDNETKKIYNDVNNIMLVHAHTGNGSDGALLKYSALDGEVKTILQGKSKIINGGFQVNQRVYVSGVAKTAGLYMHDKWKAGASGCTYTFTQSNSPKTTITITAGSLQQIIEGLNIDSGTYTLSWTGTAQGRVNGGAYGASPLTTAGITLGSNTTIEFNTGTLGAVQFELGSIATYFDSKDYLKSLSECRRYGRPMPSLVLGQAIVATGAYHSLQLDTIMRAIPSLSVTTGFSVWNASGTPIAATVTLSVMSDNILYIVSNVSSGLVAGNASQLISPAGAFLSCDL